MEVFVSCPEFKIYMSGVTLQLLWRVTPNTYYYSESYQMLDQTNCCCFSSLQLVQNRLKA